jgi:hypothetical protein
LTINVVWGRGDAKNQLHIQGHVESIGHREASPFASVDVLTSIFVR